MNSRQRILAAINHQPVDRVPIDLGGTRQSGIAALAYTKLRRLLGREPVRDTGVSPVPGAATHGRDARVTSTAFKVFDVYQMLAEIEHEVAERFGSDCVALNRRSVAFGIPNDSWRPYQLRDGSDVLVPAGFQPEADANGNLFIQRNGETIAQMPAGGFYFDRFEKYPGAAHPDLSTWNPPQVSDADLRHYEIESKALFDNTDKAIIAAFGPPFELFNGIGQGGFEDWMVTFASEDDYVAELYRKLVDAWIDNLIRFHRAVGDRVQIIQIADDFGTQHAPFLSTEMFRDKLLPAYKRGLDWIHQNTDWKVLLHSDGAIYPLLPSIIEMGVDILNPVQTTAQGMDARRLKREFGDRIAFWGGTCEARSLAVNPPDRIVEEVQGNLDTFDPLAGGFVFASVHNIQADVPPENIVALFDTARQYHQHAQGVSHP